MAPDKAKQVLDLIAECKRESLTPRSRAMLDQYAVHLITQDVEPLKMVDNLAYWLRLSDGARAAA